MPLVDLLEPLLSPYQQVLQEGHLGQYEAPPV